MPSRLKEGFIQAGRELRGLTDAASRGWRGCCHALLLLCIGVALGLPGCGKPPLIVVDVSGVPATTQRISVTATLDGQPAQMPAQFSEELGQFGIRLPEGTTGTLRITVSAVDARDCQLGTGSGELTLDGKTATYSLTIELIAHPTPRCEVRVAKAGDGMGTARDPAAGLDCGATCSAYVPVGQKLVLVAQAATGSHFLGWQGACQGAASCTLTVNGPVAVTATFAKVSAQICPQPGWCWENPLPHGISQAKVWGSSGKDLWVAGESGAVLHYDGTTWLQVPTGTTQALLAIFGTSDGEIWAGGTKGTLLRFRDGKFTTVTFPTTADINALWGTSGRDLWVGGTLSTLMHWNGTALSNAQFSTLMRPPTTIHALWGSSANDIWLGGTSGALWHYTGTEWAPGSVAGTQPVRGLSGTGPSDIWAATQDGGLYHYTGTMWQAPMSLFPVQLYDLSMSSSTLGFSVGAAGATLRYDGTKWTQLLSTTTQGLNGVYADPASQLAWAVGTGGITLTWQGSGWSSEQKGSTAALQDVWASSPSNVFAVGASGTVLRGNGTSWTSVPSGSDQVCEAVHGVDASNVWIACRNVIFKWDGATLQQSASLAATTVISSLWAIGSEVWAAGNSGSIYRKQGAGAFTQITSGTTNYLYSINGTAANDIWAVGFNGTTLHWNGSWSVVASGTTETLYGVNAVAANDVWAVGTNGTIRHYDGSSWSAVKSPTTALIHHVRGSGPTDLWAVGFSGEIFRYTGTAWQASSLGSGTYQRGLWTVSGHVWTVGDSGSILHHTP